MLCALCSAERPELTSSVCFALAFTIRQTANVLLDTELGSAKVADFGTARKGVSHASDNTHATTALVAGTKCYMPPEVSA